MSFREFASTTMPRPTPVVPESLKIFSRAFDISRDLNVGDRLKTTSEWADPDPLTCTFSHYEDSPHVVVCRLHVVLDDGETTYFYPNELEMMR